LLDNGNGKLALRASGASEVLTLTNQNTYSGPTDVSSGTLVFTYNGSATNSAITAGSSGTVRLDNRAGVVTNRLSDAADFTLNGGRFELFGHNAEPVEEFLGTLKFSAAATILVDQPGDTPTLLTFSAANRVNRGTLDVVGSGHQHGAASRLQRER
jgi:fibronectin-binding autotransporter adhesin